MTVSGERRPVGARLGDLARLTHVLSLVATLAVALYLGRHQWFVQDDWAFAARISNDGVAGLFKSHDIHWVTSSVAAFSVLFKVLGFTRYELYLVPVMLLHLACGHLLWRVLRNVGVDLWVATALVVSFLVSVNAAVISMLAIYIGATVSLAMGLILILLCNRPEKDPRLDRIALGLAVVSLTFSGISPVMIAVAGGVLALRRNWRDGVRFVAVPAAVYLAWFVLFASSELKRDTSAGSLLKIPLFIWSGVVSTVEQPTFFAGAGALVAVALTVWLVRHWELLKSDAAPAFVMAAGVVVFFLVVGPARVDVFVRSGEIESRYVYFTWPLLLPAVGLALSQLFSEERWRAIAAAGLGGLLAVHGLGGFLDEVRNEEQREADLRSRVLAAAHVVVTAPFLPGVMLDEDSAPGLTGEQLAKFVRAGDLAAPGGLAPQAFVEAALPLQARFSPTRPSGPQGAVRVGDVNPGGSGENAGCATYRSTGERPDVGLSVTDRAAVRVQPDRAGDVTVVLHAREDPSITSSATYAAGAGEQVFVELVAARGQWSLRLPANANTAVCAA